MYLLCFSALVLINIVYCAILMLYCFLLMLCGCSIVFCLCYADALLFFSSLVGQTCNSLLQPAANRIQIAANLFRPPLSFPPLRQSLRLFLLLKTANAPLPHLLPPLRQLVPKPRERVPGEEEQEEDLDEEEPNRPYQRGMREAPSPFRMVVR